MSTVTPDDGSIEFDWNNSVKEGNYELLYARLGKKWLLESFQSALDKEEKKNETENI